MKRVLKFTVVNAGPGKCYLCDDQPTEKEVFVLKDDTEICAKHMAAILKNENGKNGKPETNA